MKRATAEVALSLSRNLHPANLLLLFSEVGYAFEEVWPAIEEEWIEAVRAKDWNRFAPSQQREFKTVVINAQSEGGPCLPVSEGAGLVVEKLKRKRKWGDMTVSAEAMQKMTHLDHVDLEMAVKELLRIGLLQKDRSDTYSLDPGRQYEIDRIAGIMVERGQRR